MKEPVLFLISIVTCLIGIFTFITGMLSRAKNDGIVLQKVEQACTGIEELKAGFKEMNSSQNSLALLVNSHEEQIKTLYRLSNTNDVQTQALITIMTTLKSINERKEAL